MKRESYLRDLSSEHHDALKLVRRINKALAMGADRGALSSEVHDTFLRELEPHFLTEEKLILPQLSRLGGADLVARTLEEHRLLHRLVSALDSEGGLARFAEALEAHVRFEERLLFPACQERFDAKAIATIEQNLSSHS